MNNFSKFALLSVTLVAATGCSALSGDKLDYKSAGKGPSLEVPPDLTQLSRDNRYAIPGAAVTASTFQMGQVTQTAPTAATSIGDVRIERSGTQRWLVVNRPADKLWEPTRDFWQENGFLLTMDQANLGIMETDWAENRAKLPQDFIRNTLGKVFDSLYSTSERDKFITRIEAGKNGTTDIFISHRGMQEVYADRNKDTTMWQPRPNDPNLEAAFLGRVMQYLGADAKQIESELGKSAPARSGSAELAKLEGDTLLLSGDFERNWRRTALALDRVGLTVIGQNAERHAYLVQPAPQEGQAVATKKPGFFSRMMGKKTVEPTVYPEMIVYAEPVNGGTRLSLLNKDGSAYRGSDASTWLSRLHTELR